MNGQTLCILVTVVHCMCGQNLCVLVIVVHCVSGQSLGSFLPVDMLHIQGVHQVCGPACHGCIGQLQQDAQQHACLSHCVWQSQDDLPYLTIGNKKASVQHTLACSLTAVTVCILVWSWRFRCMTCSHVLCSADMMCRSGSKPQAVKVLVVLSAMTCCS